jgi:hypothetical protein
LILEKGKDCDLYADVLGRLTTDLNHYKYLIEGYKKPEESETLPEGQGMDNNDVPLTNPETLPDGNYVITAEGVPLPMNDVVEDVIENTVAVPAELAQIRQFCTTKRQAKCFNELVTAFQNGSKCVLTYMLDDKQLTKEFDSQKEAEDWVQEQESKLNEKGHRFVKLKVELK